MRTAPTPAATNWSIMPSVTSEPAVARTLPSGSSTSSDSVRPVPVFSMLGSLRRSPSASFSAIFMEIDRSVPQSSSRTMTSCATSTRRRVRYPESAVRSAVSARPLRAPCVEMKYSSTDRPSRKLDVIGRGMVSPLGLETRPRIPATCRTCIGLPRAPESTIIQIGLVSVNAASMSCATSAVACVQISISSWRRSSSVIRPRRTRAGPCRRGSGRCPGFPACSAARPRPRSRSSPRPWSPSGSRRPCSASSAAATSTFG